MKALHNREEQDRWLREAIIEGMAEAHLKELGYGYEYVLRNPEARVAEALRRMEGA
jgi:hypothetical protein